MFSAVPALSIVNRTRSASVREFLLMVVPFMTPEALLIGRVKPGVLLSISPGPVHLTFIAPILGRNTRIPVRSIGY
jgi:hypothetical protein